MFLSTIVLVSRQHTYASPVCWYYGVTAASRIGWADTSRLHVSLKDRTKINFIVICNDALRYALFNYCIFISWVFTPAGEWVHLPGSLRKTYTHTFACALHDTVSELKTRWIQQTASTSPKNIHLEDLLKAYKDYLRGCIGSPPSPESKGLTLCGNVVS